MSVLRILTTALKDVPTLLVATSATVRMDTYWTLMNTLAMVYLFPLYIWLGFTELRISLFSFKDINECTEVTHSCDGNASCINTIGSYNCTCNFGFEGDGLNCTGM